MGPIRREFGGKRNGSTEAIRRPGRGFVAIGGFPVEGHLSQRFGGGVPKGDVPIAFSGPGGPDGTDPHPHHHTVPA